MSTILAHAGFRVERDRLGARNSPQLIKTLTTRRFMKLTYNLPIRRFVKRVRGMGDGLYIVGLDVHVGFILVTRNRVYFIHSSYGTPAHVVKEQALRSPILSSSRYRLIGAVSHDLKLIEKWLQGRPLPTWRRRTRRQKRRR